MTIENGILKPSGVLQLKGGTYEVLSATNPFLAQRELVVETDTGKIKVGDGIHNWNLLPYIGGNSSGTTILSQQVSVTVLGVANEPAVIPASGDQYIVGDDPTGDFEEAEAGNIARYDGTTWEFLEPSSTGLEVINVSNGQIMRYTGGEWTCVASLALWRGDKILQGINVVDAEKDPITVGDTWDFSNVRVIAQYSDGLGIDGSSLVRISPAVDIDITPMCQYSPKEGDTILKDGYKEINVSYTYAGRTATATFTRLVDGDNSFLNYVDTTHWRQNSDVYVKSLNTTKLNADKPSDVVFYSYAQEDGRQHNIFLGSNTGAPLILSLGNTSYICTTNFLFPSESYNFSSACAINFCNSINFNGYVQLPNGIQNCNNTFLECRKFNQPVIIPDSVTNCYKMFYNCIALNQSVTLGESVINCGYMFTLCANFNQPVNIPDNVSSCQYMFYGCKNFNQPVTIGENVQICAFMFLNCYNFNQPVTIPDSVTNVDSIFNGCSNFNSSVTFGAGVINGYSVNGGTISSLFSSCRTIFNAPVTFSEGIESLYRSFQSCTAFNQPVGIPGSVTNAAYMFNGASAFNSSVTLEEGITSTVALFFNAQSFNRPVTIPNSVTNAVNMFYNCRDMAYNIKFPSNVDNCYYSCYNCLNISHIYIHNADAVNVVGLVGTPAIRNNAINNITIHCPNLSIINKTTVATSVLGSNITWDANWYNSQYKIQLTTNMK